MAFKLQLKRPVTRLARAVRGIPGEDFAGPFQILPEITDVGRRPPAVCGPGAPHFHAPLQVTAPRPRHRSRLVAATPPDRTGGHQRAEQVLQRTPVSQEIVVDVGGAAG